MTLTEFLTGIRGRLAAATKGPWDNYQHAVFSEVVEKSDANGIRYKGRQICETREWHKDDDTDWESDAANAALIASSPTDLTLAVQIIEVMRVGLLYIATCAPGQEQTFELENKRMAEATLAKIDALLKGRGE